MFKWIINLFKGLANVFRSISFPTQEQKFQRVVGDSERLGTTLRRARDTDNSEERRNLVNEAADLSRDIDRRVDRYGHGDEDAENTRTEDLERLRELTDSEPGRAEEPVDTAINEILEETEEIHDQYSRAIEESEYIFHKHYGSQLKKILDKFKYVKEVVEKYTLKFERKE